MKAEVTPLLPGSHPPRKRSRKPFALGAPRALQVPVEGLLEVVAELSGAEHVAAFALEGREVTLLATRGDGEPPQGRLAATALAHGRVLTETGEGRYREAIPITEAVSPASERRRYASRSHLSSACLVLEGPGSGPDPRFGEAVRATLGQALLGALQARAFADVVATDGATGALSRPAFERAAASEMEHSAAAERPAALLLIEVTGRQPRTEVEASERAMALAATELRRALRTEDLVARRGPDELVALLLDSDPDALASTAERVLDRIRTAVATLELPAPVLGAASFPAHGKSLGELDAAALDALESARAAGPGCWRVYDPSLGRSPTACRRSFFTGDPGLDARKASLLFESVLAANGARELGEALDAVLRALLVATGADRALVLSGTGAHLEVAAARDASWVPLEAPRYSRSACLRALALGRAVLITDTMRCANPVGASAHDLQLRSVVTVPLLAREGPLGVLYADSVRPSFRSYGPEDLAYLEALAAQAALAIRNAGLRDRLEEENAALKRAARQGPSARTLIGQSPALRKALEHLPEIIEGDGPVLLLGESGTGKELLARTIHQLGSRGKGNFVAQNCAAIPAELLESELFGHSVGAFSGATRAKRGLLELAHGGTFFLDEVGDLPTGLQAKLLRVLEDKQVRRIGETRAQHIDFRLICATNRDLRRAVDSEAFRADLYYRINLFTITLPPLRERGEDVLELARHFLAHTAARLGRPQPCLGEEAARLLLACPWPGNVRELANVIEKAVTLATRGVILPRHLGLEPAEGSASLRGPLKLTLARVEKDLVRDALKAHDGNVSQAARSLGIARQQLQRLIRKHDLEGPRQRRSDPDARHRA